VSRRRHARQQQPDTDEQTPNDKLADELAKMRDAIAKLTAPKLEYLDGQFLTVPGLCEQLEASIEGMRGTGNGSAARSMPPVWIDAVSILEDIRAWCSAWKVQYPGALAYLHWTPDQTPDVVKITRDVERMVKRVEHLLDPRPDVTLAAPCPRCEVATVKRTDSAGDEVNTAALHIDPDTGCNCLNCGAHWPRNRWQFLAKVLQCPLPAGVIE
jgi:hypothetical protein